MKTCSIDLKKENKKNIYTFYSAKKIFFTRTPSKAMLVEKKEKDSEVKAVSLTMRNPVIVSKNTGMLIFPKSK